MLLSHSPKSLSQQVIRYVRTATKATIWVQGVTAVSLFSCLTYGSNTSDDSAILDDLTGLGLRSLMDLEVYTASKTPQLLLDTAAAVTVITQEDIALSAHNSIAELLRMVPGMDVARINHHEWAVSARGFNELYANHLLVMIDGRSVYSPLSAGVNWRIQDYPLEDIERIEVIKGPGGSLWGANAVNGVINILTKSAKNTSGGLVKAQVNNHNTQGLGLRYGGSVQGAHAQGDYRLYAKVTHNDDFDIDHFGEHVDSRRSRHLGFRTDWDISLNSTLTLQGDYYNNRENETNVLVDPTIPGSILEQRNANESGTNVLARFQHIDSLYSNWTLQGYVDQVKSDDLATGITIDTADIDFQYNMLWKNQHNLSWGLGYRRIKDTIEGSYTVSFNPKSFNAEQISAFFQNEFTLSDKAALTLGAKLEHFEDSELELQPSLRLLLRPSSRHTWWGAVSKAVRTPARAHTTIRLNVATIPGPNPSVISLIGSEEFQTEDMLAYELGYRGLLSDGFTVDVALFSQRYDNLISYEPGQPFPESVSAYSYTVIPRYAANGLEGVSQGIELSANWVVTPTWKLKLGYSWFDVDLKTKRNSADINRVAFHEGGSPEHQLQLHAYWDLNSNISLNTSLYFTDDRPSQNINAHTMLDMNLSWQVTKDIKLNFALQNLLDDKHMEFRSQSTHAEEIPRSAYATISWQFR